MPAAQAKVPATDSAFLFGDSLYETIRTYHARPFALEEHMARLGRGARIVGIAPVPLEEIARALHALAALRAPEESCLRVNLSGGLRFPADSGRPAPPPRFAALAGPLPARIQALYERGARCAVSGRPRWNPGGFIPAVKFSCNHELRLAAAEAAREGASETLLLNAEGMLAEASSSSVFLVKGGRLTTPDLASGILDGVTRCIVLGLAGRAGLEVEERPVRPEELRGADEVFLTSTLKEVLPVVELDGRVVGRGTPGLVADRLLGMYQERALEATAGGGT